MENETQTRIAGGQQPTRSIIESLEPRRLLAGHLVADIAPGTPSSIPIEFTSFNRDVYFTVVAPFPSPRPWWQLWKSDGTTSGTVAVPDPSGVVHYSATGSSSPNLPLIRAGTQDLTVVGDRLWAFNFEFTSSQYMHVRLDSYAPDGCTTRAQIGDFNLSEFPTVLSEITPFQGKPYVYLDDYFEEPKWYTVDDSGQAVVATPGEAPSSYLAYTHGGFTPTFPGNGSTAAVANGERFYAYDDGVTGEELWARSARDVVSTPAAQPSSGLISGNYIGSAFGSATKLIDTIEAT